MFITLCGGYEAMDRDAILNTDGFMKSTTRALLLSDLTDTLHIFLAVCILATPKITSESKSNSIKIIIQHLTNNSCVQSSLR